MDERGPLDHDDYLRQANARNTAYTASINEYDRLVTWISAGALVASMTFLEKFGQNAQRETAWLLGSGWTLLLLALLSSLGSQYASSRLHSWRRRQLDHRQRPVIERDDTWRDEAAHVERVSKRWGRATKWLTAASGVVLVGGLMLLARFAFLNAPFEKVAPIAVRQSLIGPSANGPTETKPAPVPEKRGLEDIPEPVRRPEPPPPPPEKR